MTSIRQDRFTADILERLNTCFKGYMVNIVDANHLIGRHVHFRYGNGVRGYTAVHLIICAITLDGGGLRFHAQDPAVVEDGHMKFYPLKWNMYTNEWVWFHNDHSDVEPGHATLLSTFVPRKLA